MYGFLGFDSVHVISGPLKNVKMVLVRSLHSLRITRLHINYSVKTQKVNLDEYYLFQHARALNRPTKIIVISALDRPL